MFATPPVTRSKTRRAIIGSANRTVNVQDQNFSDSVLNSTFPAEDPEVQPQSLPPRENTSNGFDMTQLQHIIHNTVTASMHSLHSQLPGLINSVVNERLQNINSSNSASNIPPPQQGNLYPLATVNRGNDISCFSPMAKWNIKFTGNPGGISVSDFIFRIETLRERQNLSWSHICNNFHLLLSEKADEWYWLYLGRNGSASWTDLKSAIIREFKHRDSDFEILKSIMDYKQTNESFDEFFFKIIKMNGQMDQPLVDSKLLEILKGNLNFRLWQLTFSARVQTLDELRDYCRNAERQLLMRQSNPRRVHEIDGPMDHNLVFVEELQKDSANRRILTCWNCDQQGHSFVECPSIQRRLFCYKCGQKNVTAPDCTRCKALPLNRQVNSLIPEQICSEQNPGIH